MTLLPSSIARHFGTVARRYRKLRDLDVRVVRRVALELRKLADLAHRLLVLDAGAGTGRYTEAVLHHASEHYGLRYHGVAYDAVREMLSSGEAHQRVGTGNIDRAIGLAEFLPFPTQSFDAVLSFNAVHHFDLREFLAAAARVLRPKRRLIVYTRTPEQNQRTIWGQFFPDFAERETRLYTESALRTALEGTNKFESIELLEIPWKVRTSLSRLMEQVRSRGYSTFWFYSPEEFDAALETFEARLRVNFDDPSTITVQNDHILVSATRC